MGRRPLGVLALLLASGAAPLAAAPPPGGWGGGTPVPAGAVAPPWKAALPAAPRQVTPPDTAPHPGAALRVFLLTLGRGDAIWEKFGHNALWIRNTVTGEEAAYNWGIFDFDQVDFIPRLIRGTMLYSMAPMDPYRSLEEAQYADRRVWIQELALTPDQKWDLLAFVRWNAQPEHRDYRYDYYRDNCSTRVRDALDRVLGGALREASQENLTDHTYRWHTRRLLQDAPPAYLGIQVVLGPDADRPLTVWEEMFLPTRLMEEVRGITVPDPEGGTRALVTQERALRDSSRPPEPDAPPFAFPWFLGAGLLGGGGILALLRRGRGGGPWLRVGATILAGGWALIAGLAGMLLAGAWLFTDHTFWYQNLNLLQLNPLALLLLPALLRYAIQGTVSWWGGELAKALAVLSVLGAFLELIPGLGQGNGEVLALTLPLNLGIWAAVRTVSERRVRDGASEGVQATGAGTPV